MRNFVDDSSPLTGFRLITQLAVLPAAYKHVENLEMPLFEYRHLRSSLAGC